MPADLFLGDAAERVIQRLDMRFRPAAHVGDAQIRVQHVIGRQMRIVDLQQEAGIHDGPVFVAHRFGNRVDILLVRFVVPVGIEILDAGRRNRRDEHLGRAHAVERRLEVVEIGAQLRLSLVGDRPRADHANEMRRRRAARQCRIGFGERLEFTRLSEGAAARLILVDVESAEPIGNVGEETGLSHLAVVDDVDARGDLLAHDVGNGARHARFQCTVVDRRAG